MINESTYEEMTFIFPPGAPYSQSLHYIDFLPLEIRDQKLLRMLLGTSPQKGGEYKLNREFLRDMVQISERTLYKSLLSITNAGIFIKLGNKKASRYFVNPNQIRDLAENTEIWEKHAGKFNNVIYNNCNPLPRTIMNTILKSGNPDFIKCMEEDIKDMSIKRTRKAREIKESQRIDIINDNSQFLSEMSAPVSNAFKQVMPLLKFSEEGEALHKFVIWSRQNNNPHTEYPTEFVKSTLKYIDKMANGDMDTRINIVRKRNQYKTFVKGLDRPKYAKKIKGVISEVADRLAVDPSFKAKLTNLFKAEKDPNYKYKDKLWRPIMLPSGSPYLPEPYKEDHLYSSHSLYKI